MTYNPTKLIPARAPAVFENPAALQLAYKHAIDLADTRAERHALRVAARQWADLDEETLGALGSNHTGQAVGCACRMGVGDLYIGAVGDLLQVSIGDAAETANPGATEAETEAATTYAMQFVQTYLANPVKDSATALADFVQKYPPPIKSAYDAAAFASEELKWAYGTIKEQGPGYLAKVKEDWDRRIDQAVDLQKRLLSTGQVMAISAAVIAIAAGWALYGPKLR